MLETILFSRTKEVWSCSIFSFRYQICSLLEFFLLPVLVVCMTLVMLVFHGVGLRARILCTNILGLHANLVELAAACSEIDILVCGETKISYRRHLRASRLWLWLPSIEGEERHSWCSNYGSTFCIQNGFRAFSRESMSMYATSLELYYLRLVS